MPARVKVSKAEMEMLRELVAHYKLHRSKVQTFLKQLLVLLTDEDNSLVQHVHSFRSRAKEPSHLLDKLQRKLIEAKSNNRPFRITKENLFVKINDLIGIRILHLHTRQITEINTALKDLLAHNRYNIVEGPFARTWDDESKDFYKKAGIEQRQSGPSLYTSVHYVIDSNSKIKYTAEIQVRTLAEELWGEVAHTIDYPKPCRDIGCREQLRVLSRVTSSCTRLVDAIFRTHDEFRSRMSK